MKKIFFAFFLISSLAHAGGFQITSLSQRSNAMGGCSMALPPEVGHVYFNPGAFAFVKQKCFYIGTSLIIPSTEYVAPAPSTYSARTVNQVFTPFGLYANYRKENSKLNFGLGIYTPFGSGTKWKDDWAGQFIIQQINLQVIFVQPTVGYQINDNIGVGLGVVYSFGNVLLRQAIPVQDVYAVGSAKLQGKANGFGFNAGVYYQGMSCKDPCGKKLRAGLSYRSGVNMKAKNGTATFSVPSSLANYFPNTTFNGNIKLPALLNLGVGYSFSEKIFLTAEINYAFWSVFDSLKFDYAQNTTKLLDTRTPRLYKNSMTYRVGFCYKKNEKIKLMAGMDYDVTPAHADYITPDLPDANRFGISGGISYTHNKVELLFALEYIKTGAHFGNNAEANFSGTYQTKAIVPGVGISYKF